MFYELANKSDMLQVYIRLSSLNDAVKVNKKITKNKTFSHFFVFSE